MKIAIIVNLFPSLSETYILNQIVTLIDKGEEIKIIAHANPYENTMQNEVEKYALLNKVYYYNIPYNKLFRICRAIKIILKNTFKHPIAIFKTLNFLKYKKLALSLRLLFYIEPFIEERFDIIHCHFGPNGEIVACIKEILRFNTKIVTTFHGYDLRLGIDKGHTVYKHLFKQGDLFLYISNYTKDLLLSFGIDPSKLDYLPIGIDLEKFHFKWNKKNDIKNNCNINIITIARLVEEKGLFYGIKAVEQIINKYNNYYNIKYNIIGYGKLYKPLMDYIYSINMQKNIILFGGKNSDEIIKYLENSDIFLLPSINESFGVVLLEAQAIGLPIVATNVGGIKYAIIKNKSGFLVPEKDVDALAEKMEYLINHPEIWPEMGKAGRKYVETNYDIKKINNKLCEVYKLILD